MNKTSHLLIFNLLNHLGLLIFIFFSANNYAANYFSDFTKETDSLRIAVMQCPSDTCKFTILSNFFWQNAYTKQNQVKRIGTWAYDIIRNSGNLKALSDGYDIKAQLMQDEKKYDSAFYFYEKALKVSQNIGYKSRIAWSFYSLANLKFMFNDYDGAIKNMKYAIQNFSEIKDTNEILTSTWMIAYYYQTINYDSAIFYYEKRLSLFERVPDSKLEIILCLEIANFYKRHNAIDKSITLINRALEVAGKVTTVKESGKIYWTLGDFFFDNKKGISNTALEYYEKAKIISDETKDSLLKAIIYNRIGNFYLKEGKDSMALSNQLVSLGISKKINIERRIAVAYKSLGYTYKKLSNYQAAVNNFKLCIEAGANSVSQSEFHQIYIEIADLSLKLNNTQDALIYYKKSLELAMYFHDKNEIALSNLKIGNYYRTTNRKLAEEYYLLSLKLAEEIKNITLIKSIADTLGKYYLLKMNYKLASGFQQLARVMDDSLKISDRYADIADVEMEFELKKAEKENDLRQLLARAEIKKQKIFKDFLLLITLLLGVLGVILYRNNKRKKKDNVLLTSQKNEILEKNREIEAQVEEITAQKNEIERISHELHQSDEMKLRFFSNISHELRTPLTLILNPVKYLLKKFQGNDELNKQLETIYNNARQLHDLTNQIMDLQKLDAGKLELNLEREDIVKYCMGLVSSFDSLCSKKNNVIRFSANHSSVFLLFDKDKIGKILVNLLSNALKFCYEDSEIEVDIEMYGTLNLSITDKGAGIPPEQIDKVFKRYYQVPSESQTLGTGIGLAYVKELTGFMNGKVSIESVVKSGTKVSISIPADHYEITNRAGFSIQIPSIEKQSNQNELDLNDFVTLDNLENTVLIVEDNDELRTFIADLLKADFNICMARDGNEGIQVALQQMPDIVISDVMMPNMDGF